MEIKPNPELQAAVLNHPDKFSAEVFWEFAVKPILEKEERTCSRQQN